MENILMVLGEKQRYKGSQIITEIRTTQAPYIGNCVHGWVNNVMKLVSRDSVCEHTHTFKKFASLVKRMLEAKI